MAQEFYLKMQALHEEFQKRELHYLKTEEKLRVSIMSKKEINLPLQEYLQRINQREKESEETYRNIMKQMGELDKHTDVMSLKLEKLGILRNSLTSFALPDWRSSTGTNLQTYDTIQSFNLSSPKFESLDSNIRSAFNETNFKSISAQTENGIFCDKCHSLIHLQPRHIMENETPSFINTQSRIIGEPQTMQSQSQDYSTVNDVHDTSQLILSSGNSELFPVPANTNISSEKDDSKKSQQLNEKVLDKNIQPDVILTKKHSSFENQLESHESLNDNMQNEIIRNEEKLTELQHSKCKNYESKFQDSESNIDTFVSKSDAESMNNEFDFLESDSKVMSSKTQNVTKNHKSVSNNADVSVDKTVSLVIENPSEPPSKQNRDIFHSTAKPELSDNKSESSGSVSPPHSPNLSVASDSDSVYGKGSPLTASAAYQALLGNTISPKKIKIDNSDSESADEVENALANVVQRSNVKSESSKTSQLTETKRKPSEAVDSKPAVKGSKLPSSNKPQSKLSKNTRKVLGLDTSSGSEVELIVKTPEKKIEEDSDEFDFYD